MRTLKICTIAAVVLVAVVFTVEALYSVDFTMQQAVKLSELANRNYEGAVEAVITRGLTRVIDRDEAVFVIETARTLAVVSSWQDYFQPVSKLRFVTNPMGKVACPLVIGLLITFIMADANNKQRRWVAYNGQ